MNLRDRAKKLKTDIPAVFLSLKSKDTPLIAKILAVITIAYALSPIDLIPDFIPVLGFVDDAIILPAFIWLSLRLIPNQVKELCRVEAEDLFSNGKPKNFIAGGIIILIWMGIAVAILSNLNFLK